MTLDLYKLWPVLVVLGGCLVWFTRLEAKVAATTKDLKEGKKIHSDLTKDVQEIKLSLVRIEEHLNSTIGG